MMGRILESLTVGLEAVPVPGLGLHVPVLVLVLILVPVATLTLHPSVTVMNIPTGMGMN